MQLKKLTIKNFRNFENCTINLTNKNLVFGMNDVGKSNLLYAIRMLFDTRIRNRPVDTTDFHKQNTDDDIEISCFLDISEENEYSDILIAKAENANTDFTELFEIKLTCSYNDGDSITYLYWGTESEDLLEVPSLGIRSQLDNIFHCTFIPSQNNISNSFKDFKKELLSSHNYLEDDSGVRRDIENANKTINENVAKLSSVKSMETGINQQLSLFDKDYEVQISPSNAFGDLHNNLDLYMRDNLDIEGELIYPTSGDGRIRKVMYAIISYLLKEGKNAEGKIPILLIEEPENHLFLSAQVELSKTIFSEDFNPYLFLTTHSPHLFFRISDNANLIRLYKNKNNLCAMSEMTCVPQQYNDYKNILLESLAQCLFVDKVLLVEGESEKLLFEWVLDSLEKNRQNVIIQSILGVNFTNYVKILNGLGIEVLVKTDNDIKKNRVSENNPTQTFSAIGYNRCISLISIKDKKDYVTQASLALEYNLFREYIIIEKANEINYMKGKGIFLSKIDLENDLAEALNFQTIDKKEFIDWLQGKKWHHMWYLITLNEDELPSRIYEELVAQANIAQTIYDNEDFFCLKELVGDD